MILWDQHTLNYFANRQKVRSIWEMFCIFHFLFLIIENIFRLHFIRRRNPFSYKIRQFLPHFMQGTLMPNIHIHNNYQKAVVCMDVSLHQHCLNGRICKIRLLMNYRPVKFYFPVFIGLCVSPAFLIKDGDFKVDMSQWKFLVLRNLAGIASMLLTFTRLNIYQFRLRLYWWIRPHFLCLYCCFSLKSEHH